MKNLNPRLACLDVHSPLYIRCEDDGYGGGDIAGLKKVVDRAAEAGFSVLQLLPIQDTGLHPSPYMGVSIFSYNPTHVSVDELPENPELKRLKLERIKSMSTKPLAIINYRKLRKFKLAALRSVYGAQRPNVKVSDFDPNTVSYAVFMALKAKLKTGWISWPAKYKSANALWILENYPEVFEEVKFILWTQSLLEKQWRDLATYAKERKIELMLDKPIYPIHDSADVWANQSLFYLNSNGSTTFVSGCDNPGDPFGRQHWGHAVYQFKEKPEEVIAFTLKSIGFLTKFSGLIRLDHVLALIWKYYLIDSKTKHGHHVPALKHRFFNALKKAYPKIDFIAEDIGFVSEKQIDIPLRKHGIPGICIVQDLRVKKYCHADMYPELCAAITSNHDSLTLAGFWRILKSSQRNIYYKQMTEKSGDIVADLTRLVFGSKAWMATTTLRDLAGDLRQYNRPGHKNSRNWKLYCPIPIEKIDFSKIAKIIKETGRG